MTIIKNSIKIEFSNLINIHHSLHHFLPVDGNFVDKKLYMINDEFLICTNLKCSKYVTQKGN